MCLDAQGGIKAKRQPFVAGVILKSCVLDVVGEDVVDILSPVGTENTYTSARLEALFTSSQSSPFVPSKIRGSRFLASDYVLNPFECFRVEICSDVLLEVLVVPVHCTGPVQPGGCGSGASSSR